MRTAAIERKIHIRLLISSWKYSSKLEIPFLKSLVELTDSYTGVKIEVVSFCIYICLHFVYFYSIIIFIFYTWYCIYIDFIFQKRFVVPTNPDFDKIPFSRVNHNKYMVTDATAYIGTSNWSGDYFINTAGNCFFFSFFFSLILFEHLLMNKIYKIRY